MSCRVVDTRDAEVDAVVGAEVRPGNGLVLDVRAEVAVEDQRRAERPGVAGGGDVGAGVAETARIEAEREVVVHFGVEHRELAPDRVGSRALEGQLGVVVVAVDTERHLAREVVEDLVGIDVAAWIRHRVKRHDLLRDRIDQVRRDHEVGELVASGATGAAGERVEEPEGRVFRRHLAEVALAHQRGRHGQILTGRAALLIALDRAEVEEPVLHHRPTERATVGIARQIVLGEVERIVVERVRVELVLIAEQERRAAQVVGARLGDDRRGGAGRHAVFGVEAVGGDVDGIDRLGGLNVTDVVWQPDVDRDRAVDARRVAVRLRAVDPGAQRARRSVDGRVLLLKRRRAGHEVHQRLVVAIDVQRQIDDVLRRQLGVQIGLVGLNQRSLARDLNDLAQRADRQGQADAHGVASGDVDALLLVFTEPGQRSADVVDARQQVAECKSASFISHRLGFRAGSGVRRGNRDPGNERTLGVVDVADDAAVKDLGMDGSGEQADCTKRRANQQPPQIGPANALTHGFLQMTCRTKKLLESNRDANELGLVAFDILLSMGSAARGGVHSRVR